MIQKIFFFDFYPRTSKNTKKNSFAIFFVFRNKRRAEFWTDYHAFFCNGFRILTASVLSAHFFRFLTRDFKKITWIGSRVSEKHWVSEICHFEWVFWSPWAKIEKSEPITRKPWEFWTHCKKTHDNRFKTLPYVCSEPQIKLKIYRKYLLR